MDSGVALFVAIAMQLLARVDVHQRHGAAPHAAGIEGEDAGFVALTAQCRPVPENDFQVTGLALAVLEPGGVAGWCGLDAFLALEVELAVAGCLLYTSPSPRDS